MTARWSPCISVERTSEAEPVAPVLDRLAQRRIVGRDRAAALAATADRARAALAVGAEDAAHVNLASKSSVRVAGRGCGSARGGVPIRHGPHRFAARPLSVSARSGRRVRGRSQAQAALPRPMCRCVVPRSAGAGPAYSALIPAACTTPRQRSISARWNAP